MRHVLLSALLTCTISFVVQFTLAQSVWNSQVQPVGHSSTVESVDLSVAMPSAQWRRTTDGWETIDQLHAHTPQVDPGPAARLHPLVVSSLVVLLSLAMLVLFEEEHAAEFIRSES